MDLLLLLDKISDIKKFKSIKNVEHFINSYEKRLNDKKRLFKQIFALLL